LFTAFSAIFLLSSCGWLQNKVEPTTDTGSVLESQTNIPFSTKFPEIFSTEIVVVNIINEESVKRKFFIAKNGKRRLTQLNYGSPQSFSRIQTDRNEIFVVNHEEKTYYRSKTGKVGVEDDPLRSFLTTKFLNERKDTKFEKLGTENGLTKYRANIENTDKSEVFVFVDDELRIPVKQEFYAISNGEKFLTYSVELTNYESKADDILFEIPKDYRKIQEN